MSAPPKNRTMSKKTLALRAEESKEPTETAENFKDRKVAKHKSLDHLKTQEEIKE